MKTTKTTNDIIAMITLILMCTSTLAGLGAGIINDFYSHLEGIQIFLTLKAAGGGVLSAALLLNYLAYRTDRLKRERQDPVNGNDDNNS